MLTYSHIQLLRSTRTSRARTASRKSELSLQAVLHFPPTTGTDVYTAAFLEPERGHDRKNHREGAEDCSALYSGMRRCGVVYLLVSYRVGSQTWKVPHPRPLVAKSASDCVTPSRNRNGCLSLGERSQTIVPAIRD